MLTGGILYPNSGAGVWPSAMGRGLLCPARVWLIPEDQIPQEQIPEETPLCLELGVPSMTLLCP